MSWGDNQLAEELSQQRLDVRGYVRVNGMCVSMSDGISWPTEGDTARASLDSECHSTAILNLRLHSDLMVLSTERKPRCLHASTLPC